MAIAMTILLIVAGFIIFDLTIFGFIPFAFKIYPPFRNLLGDGVLIKDEPSDLFRVWKGHRYRCLILTENFLIIQNYFFTSVENIHRNKIKEFSIEEKLLKKSKNIITLYIVNEEKLEKLIFTTKNIEKWEKALKRIGIDEV